MNVCVLGHVDASCAHGKVGSPGDERLRASGQGELGRADRFVSWTHATAGHAAVDTGRRRPRDPRG